MSAENMTSTALAALVDDTRTDKDGFKGASHALFYCFMVLRMPCFIVLSLHKVTATKTKDPLTL
jgi:hypothetical protein